MQISFVSASYVCDAISYPSVEFNWGEAERATTEHATPQVFAELLDRLEPARLNAVEVWKAHAGPWTWKLVDFVTLRQIIERRGLSVVSFASGLGDARENLDRTEVTFQAARVLGAPVIADWIDRDMAGKIYPLCQKYGIKVGVENHPERTAQELLETIQGYENWIGVTMDTGNMAAAGGDPVKAIYELQGHIVHVHFKDILPGGGHRCCALGKGVVDVEGVIQALKMVGYDGPLSIEIETGDHDPTAEIIESAETLRALL
ncbi:MAG: sugar phosphate isomerase/epimerase [Chloroflexi bacterium]|nr:sugar phosphate isomerase/epimerase [Chloroflexota bacterium]